MPLSLEATEWLAKPTVGIRPEAPRLPWSHKGSRLCENPQGPPGRPPAYWR